MIANFDRYLVFITSTTEFTPYLTNDYSKTENPRNDDFTNRSM